MRTIITHLSQLQEGWDMALWFMGDKETHGHYPEQPQPGLTSFKNKV